MYRVQVSYVINGSTQDMVVTGATISAQRHDNDGSLMVKFPDRDGQILYSSENRFIDQRNVCALSFAQADLMIMRREDDVRDATVRSAGA
jgi:hypothetical protein